MSTASLRCSICREEIPIAQPQDTLMPFVPPNSDLETVARARLDQLADAAEQSVIFHFEVNHSIPEVLESMGKARLALDEIKAILDDDGDPERIRQAIDDGLG